MAKDLPYFKFFCSEWNDGDITLELFETQGVFINVCSYYWSNECVVTLSKVLKKFRGCDKIIEELIKSDLIKVDKLDNIVINFLDQQFHEREVLSKKNSEAGKKSAEARRLAKLKSKENKNNSTPVDIPFNENSTESQPLREDKIKKDKIKKERKISFQEQTQKFINWFNQMLKIHKGKEGRFRSLSPEAEKNYKKIIDAKHPIEDFEHVFKVMLKEPWVIEKQNASPSHFLRNDNFNRYLSKDLIVDSKPNMI